MNGLSTFLAGVLLVCFVTDDLSAQVDAGLGDSVDLVDFKDDVQPLLRKHCHRCHGQKNQEADLRLDDRAIVQGDEASAIIVPGKAGDSLLIQRLTDDSVGDLMPLDGNALSKEEISILRRWVNQGAPWPEGLDHAGHWAYEPVKRPSVPDEAQGLGAAIDYFVDRSLAARGLEPNELASRARQFRRAALALTGVPPSIEELDQFLADDSESAYEAAIDRLLASERYGERWAVPWMDLARYADSNGYQADQLRDNWAYRDWVIRALNRDMPFDQFVVDQLAGDLHSNASVEQRVATGFHRMTTVNVEAGVSPEADRVNQIVDRVNTTATVFMGTTLECAQCHDHKYDPFTQEDYYRLFAYFNNTPLEVENTSGVTFDFYGPTMDLPRSSMAQREYEELQKQLSESKAERKQLAEGDESEFEAWVAQLAALQDTKPEWSTEGLDRFETTGGEEVELLSDGSVLLSGSVPDTVDHDFWFVDLPETVTAVRVDLLTDERIPGKGPGRGDEKRSNIILSELTLSVFRSEEAEGGRKQQLALEDPQADFSQTNWDVSEAIDGDRKSGWAFSPQFGKSHWASFTLKQPLELQSGEQLRVRLGQYYGRGRVAGRPRVSFFSGDPQVLATDPRAIKLAAKKKRSPKENKELRGIFDENDPRIKEADQIIGELEKQIERLAADTTLVMVEMEEKRSTNVFVRGDYEQPAQSVSAGTPAVLPKLEGETSGDRMELALWLVAPENPLLARVTVNRWWAELFGTGIVPTLEDFGTQADFPSHPELLDWLASELVECGWSMKRIHKSIVMSRAFRRASTLSPALQEKDPDNRWLARGPRFRIPAEMIRDSALAVSGLLSDEMYGAPIMPYQPENIWRSVGRNQPKWEMAEDEARFRRGLYVVWKRAAPYPSFVTFDAPDRGSCTVGRSRSNTPLQALTLLNDPTYAEMALAFADSLLEESMDDGERVQLAFRRALSRHPTESEQQLLLKLLAEERATIASREQLASSRDQNSQGGALVLRKEAAIERAAWFAVTNTLLNLDEFLCY